MNKVACYPFRNKHVANRRQVWQKRVCMWMHNLLAYDKKCKCWFAVLLLIKKFSIQYTRPKIMGESNTLIIFDKYDVFHQRGINRTVAHSPLRIGFCYTIIHADSIFRLHVWWSFSTGLIETRTWIHRFSRPTRGNSKIYDKNGFRFCSCFCFFSFHWLKYLIISWALFSISVFFVKI